VEGARGTNLGPMDYGPEGVGEKFPNGRVMGPCVEEPKGFRFFGPKDNVWVVRH
jgi:hypothetical protein